MSTERHEFWVCIDCYFAHHYGAYDIVRAATDSEEARYLNGYADRSLMGLEFIEDVCGLQVREWFAGESDTRCEGGEPLRRIPDDAEVFDWTCSNHFYGQDVTPDDWDEESGEPEPVCEHCGETGWEDGITDFTWSSCDGCGSHLGGSRHRLAVDIDHPEEVPA